MKTLALILVMAASCWAETIADLSGLMNQHPSAALKVLGNPGFKEKTGASWNKSGWDLGLRFENGKIVQANIESIPKDRCPQTLDAAADLFGFTDSAGWKHGKPFKIAAMDCLYLTHMKHGIITLKASPGDAAQKWSMFRFLTNGRE